MSTREVTAGLAAAVVAAGPPPAPVLSSPWLLRLIDPEGPDPGLVSRWMREPHVDLFWEQAWSPEQWADVHAEQLKGHCTRPYIVLYEGEPLAYVEIYRTPRDVVGQVYDADPYDLGLHLAIGDRARTGRGLGRAMVRAIAVGLQEQDVGLQEQDVGLRQDRRCKRVLADPDERHVMARRMFLGAGFQLLGIRDLGHKRAALHVYDLSAERTR